MIISQDLKPLLKKIDSTTYFCFNPTQSRFIAKELNKVRFQKRLIDTLELERRKMQELFEKKDTILFQLESRLENLLVVKENQKLQMDALHLKIKTQNKTIKKNKTTRFLLTAGVLVLSVVILVK